MKQTTLFLICVLGSGLVATATAQAETRYVTDQFKIMMRTGEGIKHKINRRLSSGSEIEVLEDNRALGYSKVRTSGGTIGYVLTRQLMSKPSARDQVSSLQTRLDELQAAPGELSSRLAKLQEEHQTLKTEHSKLQKTKGQLDTELERLQRTSSNAVRISNERNELRKTVVAMTRETEDLKQENRDLNNRTQQNWFLIGAGVIAAGIILGLILPHLRFQRKKNSWGSL